MPIMGLMSPEAVRLHQGATNWQRTQACLMDVDFCLFKDEHDPKYPNSKCIIANVQVIAQELRR